MNHEQRAENFVNLMAVHQRRIYAYILTLVSNRADADDLLQQTCLVLWSKFDKFEPGSHFAAWACRVAYLEVLAFRRQKTPLVDLGDDLLELIADRTLDRSGELDLRYEALGSCVEGLSATDRDLLRRRYTGEASVPTVATEVGRPAQGLYKAYNRIHKRLFECIQRRLAREDSRVE